MYLIVCRQCHADICDEARICPRCGHMLLMAKAPPSHSLRGEPLAIVQGTSQWHKRRPL